MQARMLSGASAGCSGRGLEDTHPRSQRGHCGLLAPRCKAQDSGRPSQQTKRRGDGQAAAAGSFAWQNMPSGAGGYSSGAEERQRQWHRCASPRPAVSQDNRQSFTASEHQTGVLKINVDLLLYRARTRRKNAVRAASRKARRAQMQRAEELFRRCLDMAPCDGRAYVGLGRILVDAQRYGEAVKLYEEGVRLTEGKNAFLWASWAHLEAKMGNEKAARKLFDASTVANSEHAAAWHGWGLLEKRSGNTVRARDIWMKGIRKTKQNPNPYLYQSVGLLAAEMGLPEEARKWFLRGTRSLQGQASHALWVAWALMEADQGDDSAVRYLFRKCLDVAPRSRYLHLAWAKWELEQCNMANACKLLERGHQLNPQDGALLQALARVNEKGGDYDAAQRHFEMASEVSPRDLHVWQAWGVMEFRRGNLERARELLQQGVWANSGSRDVAYIWQAWGVLEAKAGKYQLARQLFRCAVKVNPQSEPSWSAWAQMEGRLGFLQRANDLRKYSLEERTVVVPPRSFADPDKVLEAPLEPILQQVTRWLNLFEARSLPRPQPNSTDGAGSSMTSGWLAPDGSDLRPPPRRSSGAGPGVGALLDPREAAEMTALAASTSLDLPVGSGVKAKPVRKNAARSSTEHVGQQSV